MTVRVPSAVRTPPPGPATTYLLEIVNQANRYTLGTWLPVVQPGTGPVVPTSNGEAGIRPLASAALCLGAALVTGTHDATVTGKTTTQARTQLVRVVDGLAVTHLATSPTGWGGGWQGALWACQVATAAWSLWADLSVLTRARVVDMVTFEADRMLARPLGVWCTPDGVEVTPGNSLAEEIAWDASALALAVVMLPTHERVSAWTARLVQMAIAAFTTPQDAATDITLNGVVVADVAAAGYNVRPDGMIVNHDRVHPEYTAGSFTCLWWTAGLFGLADALWPAGAAHNAALVYGGLHRTNFPAPPFAAPGGTVYVPGSPAVYYPGGSDWGTELVMHHASADLIAAAFGWGGPNAAPQAVVHLARQRALQARSTTGQTYIAPEEFAYSGAEQVVAAMSGMALLCLCSTVTESNAPAAELAVLNAGRGRTFEESPVSDWESLTLAPGITGVVTHPPMGRLVGDRYELRGIAISAADLPVAPGFANLITGAPPAVLTMGSYAQVTAVGNAASAIVNAHGYLNPRADGGVRAAASVTGVRYITLDGASYQVA